MFRNNISRDGKSNYSLGQLQPLQWTSENLSLITSPPSIYEDGSIFVPTRNGFVKLNKNGQKIWKVSLYPSGSPVFDEDGNLYFGSSGCNPYLYSLTPDGNIRWKYNLIPTGGSCGDNQSNSALAISVDKKTIYAGIGSPSLSIMAFNLDGTVKWKRRIENENPWNSAIAIDSEGTLYVGGRGRGYLFSLSPEGKINWLRATGSGITVAVSTPVLDASNNVYITTWNATGGEELISYSKSGNWRWKYKLNNKSFADFLALKDTVVYASSENNLLAIDTSNGSLLWKWSAPTGITLTSPLVDKNGTVYIAGLNKVYAINKSGSLTSEITLSAKLTVQALSEDGLLYVSQIPPTSFDGYLHALGQPEISKTFYPVIFIPGIGGSEFKANQDIIWSATDGHGGTYSHAYPSGEKIWVNEGEAIMPGDDDYFDVLRLKSDGQTAEADIGLTGNLTPFGYPEVDSFFESLGLEKGKSYFIFPYDWRKDIRDSETSLGSLIDQAIEKSGSPKVNIVAHSMGGLVARNYIVNPERAQKVNKLISLGVPNLGSTKALKTMVYGTWLGRDFYLFQLGITASEVKDVFQNLPSAFQLLPTQSFFNFYDNSTSDNPFPFFDDRDIDNNGATGPLNFSQIKELLNNLGHNMTVWSIAQSFWDFLNPNLNQSNGVKLYHIVGSGQPTLGQIKEGWLINWPLKLIPKYDETYINGDETVPLYSASLKSDTLDLSGGAKIYYVEQSHIDLVTKDRAAMQTVRSILLEGDQLPVEVQTSKIILEGQHLSVDNDAELDLFDDDGNHTGLKSTEEVETNIPDTFFSTLGNTKHAFIKKKSKKVKVTVKSKKQDKTTVKIRSYKQEKISKTVIYKNLQLSDTTSAQFIVDPALETSISLSLNNQTISPSVEVEGSEASDVIPPQTLIQIDGTKNDAGVYTSPVTVTLTAADNISAIAKIYYSLDGGKSYVVYTEPFTITAQGSTTLIVTSEDQLGNAETPQTILFNIITSLYSTPTTTATPNPTLTPTQTNTPSPTSLITPTITLTPTRTLTITPTPTLTPTPFPSTVTPTPTPISIISTVTILTPTPTLISILPQTPYLLEKFDSISIPPISKPAVANIDIVDSSAKVFLASNFFIEEVGESEGTENNILGEKRVSFPILQEYNKEDIYQEVPKTVILSDGLLLIVLPPILPIAIPFILNLSNTLLSGISFRKPTPK